MPVGIGSCEMTSTQAADVAPLLPSSVSRIDQPAGSQDENESGTSGVGQVAGSWTSPNGVYQAYIYVITSEGDIVINDGGKRSIVNPDDPNSENIEAVAWFDAAHLPEMPALRSEMRESTDWPLLNSVCGAQPGAMAPTP